MSKEVNMEIGERKSTGGSAYKKTIVIPVEKEMWQSLRQISFDHQISMSQLARWGIEKIIKKYKKDVDM